MTLPIAFVVQHLREDEDGYDDVKLIGVYSTQELAEAVVERYKKLPGFSEYPEGFDISGYELDKDHWTEGFVDLSDADAAPEDPGELAVARR